MIVIRTKYYNSSNNFQAPVKREPKPYSPYTTKDEIIVPQRPKIDENVLTEASLPVCEGENKQIVQKNENNFELSLKTDDLLLLGLILMLLPKAKDNLLLILALGYLLIF